MIELLRQLQQEMDSLGETLSQQIGALRVEMREGFARQGAIIDKHHHILTELSQKTNELSQKTNELDQKTNELAQKTTELAQKTTELAQKTTELDQETTELGRDIARQGAAFDQAMAGMQEGIDRSRKAQTTIWTMVIERAAERENDVEALKDDTKELRHRVDNIERRIAG